MGIVEQEKPRGRFAIGFWVASGMLFVLAVALRWARLDLMSFNFDQAAICARAAQIYDGHFPFTGIVNSLGFENAPGYVWSILPVFAITCNPLLVTAWHGLLCATMVFPLALLGRRFRNDAVAWLPAILAAVLPFEVLAGRTLWAQYLVTPLAAWGLWALICAIDEQLALRSRQRFGAAALGLLAWAVSVHYGAAPILIVAVLALWRLFLGSRSAGKLILVIPTIVVVLTMLPSVADWMHRLGNPLPKPAYASQFEARIPTPLPWWGRLTDAVSASLLNSSWESAPVLETVLTDSGAKWLHRYDLLVGLLVVAGVVACLILLLTGKSKDAEREKAVALLLLSWIALPIFIGGLFFDWVQVSYFAASLPAGWVAILFVPRFCTKRRRAVMSAMACLLGVVLMAGGVWFTGNFLRIVSQRDIVAARYYIPFRWQLNAVFYLREHGVERGRLHHLSGPTFEQIYDYLLGCAARHDTEIGVKSAQNFAVMEDHFYAAMTPERLQFLKQAGAKEMGPVLIKIMPSRGAADIFTQQYYQQGQ